VTTDSTVWTRSVHETESSYAARAHLADSEGAQSMGNRPSTTVPAAATAVVTIASRDHRTPRPVSVPNGRPAASHTTSSSPVAMVKALNSAACGWVLAPSSLT
jgi:hypothetical protein